MLKSKIGLYVIIALLVGLIGQFVYFKHENNRLLLENADLKEEKKVELKRVRDSAFVRIETLTQKSNERFDSILNIPPTIKWRKYEKPVYIDRTLDDALRIHSKYKADTRATKEDI